ncbi:MAG TPA: PEGA domain-containing protein [Candidatus Udaeobacter sp.]|nr:PEGA domain-containing protein [Candidatus Udaeobacter sp.]
MDVDAPATLRWSVSARPDGELLTIWRGGEDVLVGVLAVPGSFAREEYEAWLSDLVGVVRETSRTSSEPGPIPALLHQALTGLLFSHTGLWDRSGVAHGSIALIAAGTDVGVGWVGDVDAVISVDGHAIDQAPVIVRDAEGREARAVRLDGRHSVSANLVWRPNAEQGAAVRVEADWAGLGGAPAVAIKDEPAGASKHTADVVDEPAPAQTFTAEESVEAASPGETRTDIDRGSPREDESIESPAFEDRPETPALRRVRRGNALTDLWDWLTRPFRGRTRAVNRGDDPPWVDVGGLATAEGSEEFFESMEPNLRALGPPAKAEAPRLRSPGLDPDAIAPPDLPPADLHPGLRAIPADPSAAATTAPRLKPREPEPLAATLEPHAPLLESPVIVVRGAGAAAPPSRQAPNAPGREVVAPREVASTPERPSLASPVGFEAVAARPIEAPTARPTRRATASEEEALEPAADAEVEWRKPLRPRWPSQAELEAPLPLWRRRWVWAVGVAVLFGGGWLVGAMQTDRETSSGTPNALTRALHAIGIGGARFDCVITSTPPGAWISVDGRDLARRTPATIELKPGAHQVSLSLQDLGVASLTVRGSRGERQSVEAPLWGSLSIEQTNPQVPVEVSVDGRELGYVPVVLDSVMPGTHEVRFSGPGMTPWAQTVEVRVRGSERVVAQPMTSPKTGVLVVSATRMTETGSADLSGGEVWIDGVKRGETPLTLELPRGPHSVRVATRIGESSAVQVIDLPGGNQRFASFELGLGEGGPRLTPVQIADHVAVDRPTLVSANLPGIQVHDVREMWLHVRSADGIWRRYALDVMKTSGGTVGVTVFPVGVFDEEGRTQYYLSALVATGDEYFTEMATAQLGPGTH